MGNFFLTIPKLYSIIQVSKQGGFYHVYVYRVHQFQSAQRVSYFLL
nr:MAG TPA: hypothetical protein [Caudoviricetes sp.]